MCARREGSREAVSDKLCQSGRDLDAALPSRVRPCPRYMLSSLDWKDAGNKINVASRIVIPLIHTQAIPRVDTTGHLISIDTGKIMICQNICSGMSNSYPFHRDYIGRVVFRRHYSHWLSALPYRPLQGSLVLASPLWMLI
jgi:hypothetical protein